MSKLWRMIEGSQDSSGEPGVSRSSARFTAGSSDSVHWSGMPTPIEKKPDWFDKLPRKTRFVLLMLFTGTVSLVFFLHGAHLFRTGEYSNYAGHEESWWGSFFWGACWLVITGALAAVYFGWMKDRDGQPPQPGGLPVNGFFKKLLGVVAKLLEGL